MDLGDNGIGTEHLLIGILAEGKGGGARIPLKSGISQENVTAWIAQATGTGRG
jgi:Clp amino terminal domain, pathogenicity island component